VKADDGAIRGSFDHTELVRVRLVDGKGRDGNSRLVRHVFRQHRMDIHTVDVVGTKDDHMIGTGLLDQIDILVKRVRRALIPALVFRPHLGGYWDNEVFLQ
jgi:hypothetical protein